MKNFYVGAAYYPELWDKAEIERDIAKMKEYGMNCMRIGEFAWSSMEASEGEYNFDFFKYVVDKLYENGIYTIMCTPSCTPPRWVFEKYPDAMRVKSKDYIEYQEKVHARVHPCKSHEGMRELNVKIAREMAKAFGNHPGIIGWQIDNEVHPYDHGCYCEKCKNNFRNHLKNKYNGDIVALNKAWGTYRWSLDYKTFDQIEPPVLWAWENPSLVVEWVEFNEVLICSYVHEQAEALREYTNAPIGTDLMVDNYLSYNKMNKKLDVVQHNHYHTTDNLYRSLFNYDFYRPLKDRPFWVTETLLGWNGSTAAYNGYRPNDYSYVNSLLSVAHGSEMNLYWLFRSHPNGHELGHGAFLNSSGRPNPASRGVKKLTDVLTKAESFLANSKTKSKIAMTYSSNSVKIFFWAPLVAEFDNDVRAKYIDLCHNYFRHYNIDVIETDKDLSEYEIIVSPFLPNAARDGFETRIVEWINNGGTWIVGPHTDIMTECASKYTDKPYSFLEELCGVYTKYQLPIQDKNIKAKWNDNGEEIQLNLGTDAYEVIDAESLATYESDELENLTAIARRKVGKGQVIILGSAIDKKSLLKLVDKKPTLEASENIDLTQRFGEENGIIAIEIEGKDGYIVLDKEYYDVLADKKISGRVEMKPYDAYILKEI